MACGRRRRKACVGSETSAWKSEIHTTGDSGHLLTYGWIGMKDLKELTWETSTGLPHNSWPSHLPSTNPLLQLRHHHQCMPRCRPRSRPFEHRTYRRRSRTYFHISLLGTSGLSSGSIRSYTLHPISPLWASITWT